MRDGQPLLVLIPIAMLLTLAQGSLSLRSTEGESGHSRLVDLLRRVAERTPPGYPWVQDLEGARRRVESEAPGPTAEQRILSRVALAQDELLLGNTDRAIKLFSQAYQLARELPQTLRLTYLATIAFDLGVSHLRRGENQNCIARHTGDACILPFTRHALHRHQEGSRQAIRYFASIVRGTHAASPIHLASKWLLNIAYMTLGEYPHEVAEELLLPPEVFSSRVPFPRFRNVAPRLNLDSFDLAGGAVVDDFDGDGFLDILTSSYEVRGSLHLFRNNGDGTFTELTEEAGLQGLYGGLNLVQADYDNDGDVDVLVLRGAWLDVYGRQPNSLLRNNGDMTFTDVTFESGLGQVHYPTQTASWADYDNDGDLDLYVGNESSASQRCPSQLFRNQGNGTFIDLAQEAGVENLLWSKGVVWGDYNGDRFPDLYVSNFQGPNRLYRNNQDGTFTDVAVQSGVQGPKSSFPTWFWDIDNDGNLDLMVQSYQMPLGSGPPDVWYVAASHLGLPQPADLPSLYRGDGSGGFVDVAGPMGLKRVNLPMGANFGDLDNDGYLDFYLGTGYPGLEGLMPNVMYWNRGGNRFENVTYAGGFGHLQKGHAIAFADLDNDGDQDIFQQMGGFLAGDRFHNALFENPGFGNHWISIQLEGVESNRSAVGARLRLELREGMERRTRYRWVNSGGSFGANPLRQHIGLGRAKGVERMQIDWPSGRTQHFHNVPGDQFIHVREDQEEYVRLNRQSFRLGRSGRGPAALSGSAGGAAQ